MKEIDITKSWTIDDVKTVIEDEYLQVQIRPDSTKYIYPGSVIKHLTYKAGKEVIGKTARIEMKLNQETATVSYFLVKTGTPDKALISDIQTNNDMGTYLIPYDEYINIILPKLLEGVKTE